MECVVVADRSPIDETPIEGPAIITDGIDAGSTARITGGPCRRITEIAKGIVAEEIAVVTAVWTGPGNKVDMTPVISSAVESAGIEACGTADLE